MSAKRKSTSPKTSSPKGVKPMAISPPTPLPDMKTGLLVTLVTLLILLLVAGVVWQAPRMIGDLYVALAGGRDVANGQLGKYDDWSFVTAKRIWLNQNWGSDLIFYTIQNSLGDNGLLGLKAILIAAFTVFTVLAIRRRKVPWAVAFLVTGLMIISARSFIDLRPNLMTLIFAALTLWLLYRTPKKPVRIWWAAGVILLWANLHGGFIFGLGMLWLWTICVMITGFIKDKAEGFKPYIQLILASIATLLLTGFVTPFGLDNLIHPLTMLFQNAWRNVAEWKPIWSPIPFGSVWEYIIITSIIIIISVTRLVASIRAAKLQGQSWWGPNGETWENTGLILFEVMLFIIVTFMAVTSRRFIPMALLLAAPVLALQVWWMMRVLQIRWLLVVLGLMIVIMTYTQFDYNRHFYAPENPMDHQGTLFEKMNMIQKFYPYQLTQFVNENHIGGNTFTNWDWEGYMRWLAPQVKVFIGGRAQQVYTLEEFEQHLELLGSENPAEIFKQLNVHFLMCSFDTRYRELINRLVISGKWVYLYNDNRSCILADIAWPQTRKLVEQLLQGKLIFKNKTDELLSQASCILCPALNVDHAQALGMLKEAVTQRPMTKAYMAFSEFIFVEPKLAPGVVRFFEEEEARLSKMNLKKPEGEEILNCRYIILANLRQYYNEAQLKEQTERADQALRTVKRDLTIMHLQWGNQ
jgi:hypothetical protein